MVPSTFKNFTAIELLPQDTTNPRALDKLVLSLLKNDEVIEEVLENYGGKN